MKYSALIALAATVLIMPQSAQAAKQKLLIGGFEDVIIEGDMQVNITTGKPTSGTATGDRRIIELLKTENSSSAIKIRVQRPLNNNDNVRVTEPLVVNLFTQKVRNITVRGNARLLINNIVFDRTARISMDGAGEIEIGQMKVDKLSVVISGSGKVTVAGGSTRETDVQIQGSGNYLAENFKTRKFELIQNGNGRAAAQVEEGAIISNAGAGNITITGNAECLIRRAGLAVIMCPSDKKAKTRK